MSSYNDTFTGTCEDFKWYIQYRYVSRDAVRLKLKLTDCDSQLKFEQVLQNITNRYLTLYPITMYIDLSETTVSNVTTIRIGNSRRWSDSNFFLQFSSLPKYDNTVKNIIYDNATRREDGYYWIVCSLTEMKTETFILHEGLENLRITGFRIPLVENLTLPSTLKSLQFSMCTANTFPTIPEGVTSLQDCFESTFTKVLPKIPSTVTNMKNCFRDCLELTEVENVPEGVTNLQECFSGCTRLTKINDFEPLSVTGITMTDCFKDCSKLVGIYHKTKESEITEYNAWRVKITGDKEALVSRFGSDGLAKENFSRVPFNNPVIKLTGNVDELVIAPSESLTNLLIKHSIESQKPISSFQKLDPDNKSIVLWAENPSTLMTNMVFPNGLTTTCNSGASETTKEIVLSNWQGDSLPDNCEINVTFTNANTYGETTASTPTNPKLLVKNANGDTIHTLDICDSRGHVAGTGCWNAGDLIVFKKVSSKAIITNSDVRQSTNDYKIYSDNLIEYTKNKVDSLLNNKQNVVKTVYVNYGNISVSSNNYYPLSTNVPEGKTIIGYNIRYWNTNSACFSITPYLGNRAYVIANNGTSINNLQIDWYYI